MADFSNMTDDEVVAASQALGAQIDELRAQRMVFADEMRRRTSAASQAAAALAALSPEALEELKKLLPGTAVASAELPTVGVDAPQA